MTTLQETLQLPLLVSFFYDGKSALVEAELVPVEELTHADGTKYNGPIIGPSVQKVAPFARIQAADPQLHADFISVMHRIEAHLRAQVVADSADPAAAAKAANEAANLKAKAEAEHARIVAEIEKRKAELASLPAAPPTSNSPTIG